MAFNTPMNMVPFSPMMHHESMHPMHPMHHESPMHPMHPMHHEMPMHPMHHGPTNWPMTPFDHMNMHPMHPMHPMHMNMNMNTMNPMNMSMMNTMNPMSMMNTMNPMSMMNMMSPMHMMNHSMKNWMRHALPREIRDVAFRPMSMVEYNTFLQPVTYHPDGSRALNLCFDVKGFKPEEIKVEVLNKERAIVVEAKHEVKEKEHNVTRHFTRKFIVPEELHIDLSKVELKSCLTPEGLLVIEAVLPRLTVEELKAIREKSTKSPMHHTMHPTMESAFNPTVAIPVKMN